MLLGRPAAAPAVVPAAAPPAPAPAASSPGLIMLSLQRPLPFGNTAPHGRIAQDLPFIDSAIIHPGSGLTPERLMAIYHQAESGDPSLQCRLFDDLIEGDGHARSLFEKREQAVAGKPRVFQAGDSSSDGALAAEVMRTVMERLPLVDVFDHMLRFNRYGYAGCEIDWGILRIDSRDWIVPTWFAPVQPWRFRINSGLMAPLVTGGLDELRLITDYRNPFGDELVPGKWFTIRRSATALARAGLGRTAAWPMLGKKLGWNEWLIWLEKFGQPLPVAFYEEGSDPETKAAAREAVRDIGNTNGAILPRSVKLEFPEAGRSGDSGSVHPPFIAHCNAELSKLVNGSTLTNDNAGSGGASYALGSVHEGVRWEAVQYDAEKLETAFETCVSAAFVAYNDLRCAPPKLKIQIVRDLDPMTRVQVASKFRNELGGEVSVQQMRQELGFREPSGDTDKLPGMPVKPTATKPIASPTSGEE